MILYRAAWVLPIAARPLRDGWVLVADGRIEAFGLANPPPDLAAVDLGDAAILPGLVNAHTHLELSWMRGRVPAADTMPAWASELMRVRRTVGSQPAEPIAGAIRDLRAAGTSLVGDVTNTLAAYDPLADSELSAAIFREVLGFKVDDPGRLVAEAEAQLDALTPIARLRPGVVPHAPYSVSPALFKAIAAAAGDRPVSLHVAESAEEVRFLRDGTGAWRELLGQLDMWNDDWIVPGCSPVEYLARLGLVGSRLLAVHCTHVSDDDLGRLAVSGATVVTCPRSNRWTGAGIPPIDRFYASGVRVAIGTDSLASVDDLNLFAELAEVRRLAPVVPAARLLESATVDGAAALGFGELGTIEPGKRAELIAVRVPPATKDVEEYLVGGIEPRDIRWLDRD